MYKIPQSAFPFLQNALTSGLVRRPVWSLAIGYLVAQASEIAPVVVQDQQLLAQSAIAHHQSCFVGALSDVVPTNTKEVVRCAKAWYLYRYAQLNLGQQVMFANDGKDGLCQILGLNLYFSEEDLDILRNQTEEFKTVVASLQEAMIKCCEYIAREALQNLQEGA